MTAQPYEPFDPKLPTHRRTTLRDETLPHQIVLLYVGSGPKTGVSCNCQRRGARHRMFAVVSNLDEAWSAYKDPRNHRGLTT